MIDSMIDLNLEALRQGRGLTLEEIARRTGMSQSKYAKIETKKIPANDEDIRRIADALGVSVDEIERDLYFDFSPDEKADRLAVLLFDFKAEIRREMKTLEGYFDDARKLAFMIDAKQTKKAQEQDGGICDLEQKFIGLEGRVFGNTQVIENLRCRLRELEGENV